MIVAPTAGPAQWRVPPSTLIRTTVSGTVNCSANASDSSGISNVAFYLDGIGLNTDTASPYVCKSFSTSSYKSGAMTIKTLVTPEWWLLAPLPVAFLLLAIEMLFRMRRLALAERAPREDAVTAA